MHEIGHGLGLLYYPGPPGPPPSYDPIHPVLITDAVSTVYAGYEIYVSAGEHLAVPSLMASSTDPGSRFFPPSNDILAMAVPSQYDAPVLNPYHVPGVPVPEPSGLVLEFIGLLALSVLLRPSARA